MTRDEMRSWADSMRAAGVQSITTKEFSLTLDPLGAAPVPKPFEEDVEEVGPIQQIPGMCRECQNNPIGGMMPGLCRECTAKEIQSSVDRRVA